MYVMGNFAVGAMKDAGLTNDQIDFFQFPEITPGMPRAEEAPADALFIPSGAKNKADARKFLAFVPAPRCSRSGTSPLASFRQTPRRRSVMTSSSRRHGNRVDRCRSGPVL